MCAVAVSGLGGGLKVVMSSIYQRMSWIKIVGGGKTVHIIHYTVASALFPLRLKSRSRFFLGGV